MDFENDKLYKIYLGQYERIGNPATWTLYGAFKGRNVKSVSKDIAKQLVYGADIYIVSPEGDTKAYYRDKLFA